MSFTEMQEVFFDFGNDWNSLTLADEEGTPYEFYLTAGTHTIRLEATLGGLGHTLSELSDSSYRLNQMYRKILVYTGASPDKYRDYHIESVYPEVIEAMDNSNFDYSDLVFIRTLSNTGIETAAAKSAAVARASSYSGGGGGFSSGGGGGGSFGGGGGGGGFR